MGLLSKIRSFLHKEDGVAAAEFAMLAPILIILYVGTVESTNMLSTDRRMTNATSSVADLVARATYIDDAEMAAVFSAVQVLMEPADTSTMKIVVTSVKAVEESGQIKHRVAWSDSANANGTARAKDSLVTLPATSVDLIALGETLIMAEVAYKYEPLIGQAPLLDVFVNGVELDETFYLKPRRVASIPRCSAAQNGACP